jgi:hypothetical protein
MKRILDYDPETHTTQYHSYDSATDTTVIETVQDVQPYLEHNRNLRNNEDYSAKGIKNEFWHYASIPNVVIEKILMEYGVNVYSQDPEERSKVIKIINSDFPYLKVTTGKH